MSSITASLSQSWVANLAQCQRASVKAVIIGILIPSKNEPGEHEKAKKLEGQTHTLIAQDMIDVAQFIVARKEAEVIR